MMMENKKTAFEHWLSEYGSHLEQLAGSADGSSCAGALTVAPADAPRPTDIASQGR